MDSENKTTNGASSGVMDIQAPQPTNPTANPVSTEPVIGGPAVDSAATPVTTPAVITEALSGTEPVSEPSSTEPSSEVTPVEPTGSAPAPDLSASGSEPAPTGPSGPAAADGSTPPAAGKPPKKHHGAPVAAVVVAIIIALALVAIAVFAYMKSKDKKAAVAPAPPATSTVSNSVSTQDVDSTTSAIDTNLQKVDEAKDFPTTDLTDSSLSLQ